MEKIFLVYRFDGRNLPLVATCRTVKQLSELTSQPEDKIAKSLEHLKHRQDSIGIGKNITVKQIDLPDSSTVLKSIV